MPLRVFYSYAHEDEDLRDKLETHLSSLKHSGAIESWHDRQIIAGTDWRAGIDRALDEADIVLVLVSADFLASDFCYSDELKRALERRARGEAMVIPVILRPVDWESTPLACLQALPEDARPVTTWRNRDRALKDVARGVRRAVEQFAAAKATAAQSFEECSNAPDAAQASLPALAPAIADSMAINVSTDYTNAARTSASASAPASADSTAKPLPGASTTDDTNAAMVNFLLVAIAVTAAGALFREYRPWLMSNKVVVAIIGLVVGTCALVTYAFQDEVKIEIKKRMKSRWVRYYATAVLAIEPVLLIGLLQRPPIVITRVLPGPMLNLELGRKERKQSILATIDGRRYVIAEPRKAALYFGPCSEAATYIADQESEKDRKAIFHAEIANEYDAYSLDDASKLSEEWHSARNIAPDPVSFSRTRNKLEFKDISSTRPLSLRRLAADIKSKEIQTYVADIQTDVADVP